MIVLAPKIDQRSAATIAQQVKQLLTLYLPEAFATPDAIANQGIQAALIAAFSRHTERIIQRLNQVPDKNLLAFLNLLGASQLPPQPAQVPLTFFLSQGSTVDTIVPAGTTVAASGGGAAVTFETEQELVVTATQLVSVFARDPLSDRYSDYSAIAQTSNCAGVATFVGNQPIDHLLSISHSILFNYPSIQEFRLVVKLKQPIANPDPRELQWDIWDGQSNRLLTPQQDTTAKLTTNNPQDPQGKAAALLVLPLPPAVSQSFAQGSPSDRWLRGRLLTPIAPATALQQTAVRANSQDPPIYQLPEIQSLQLQAKVGRSQLPVDAAFSNRSPVNLQQPFFPFGEKPHFADTFYLACQEGFAFLGALVTLHIDVVDPVATGANPNNASALNPTLQWEFWNGQVWKLLGSSTRNGSNPSDNQFSDETLAFTNAGLNIVKFTFLEQPSALTINGTTNFWIRARIAAGDYGKEAQFTQSPTQTPPSTPSFQSATFVPPIINTATVDYSLTTPLVTPDCILTTNDFVVHDQTQPGASNLVFSPFQPTEDTVPSLYLGFQPPVGQPFPNRPLNLYLSIVEVLYGTSLTGSANASQSSWEYWNGDRWTSLTVLDGTHGLKHSGLVEFLAPADFTPRLEFGLQQYWLRIVWQGGVDAIMPRLQQIMLNTAIATQITTLPLEILGSSNDTRNQVFRTTRTPVLSGQSLEVREPEQPELVNILTGTKSETVALTVTPQVQDYWVQWQEVPDFYGSAASDRHYTINHLTGEVSFGDGLNGRIPPLGTSNVRIHYRTGGGAAGNRPIGDVAELKTTIPFIDSVRNRVPATGGTDAESLDALKNRAPHTVRHGGRAVTLEDYEDLALLASPGVARAKCIPTCNLAAISSQTVNSQPFTPGYVSVIIVPQTTDLKPIPSLELIERVQGYLEANAIATASIAVVGPAYVRVSVSAEVALTNLNQVKEIDQAIQQNLIRFLHPLTGGFDGTGWIFGREPHRSDLYALLEAIPGVDHIRSLSLTETEDFPNAKQSDRYLIYSGDHTITYTLNN